MYSWNFLLLLFQDMAFVLNRLFFIMVSEIDVQILQKFFHRIDFQNIMKIHFKKKIVLNEIFETQKNVINFLIFFFVRISITVGLEFCFRIEFEKF